MKRKRSALIFLVVAVILLDAVAIGLVAYEYWQTKTVARSTITRSAILLAGTTLTLVKALTGRRRAPKRNAAFYRKHYGDLLGAAFLGNPKGEKQMVKALDAFNGDRSSVAIKTLNSLWPEVENAADRFAVAAFLGLCYDDAEAYYQAVEWYERANSIMPNTTMCSNAGICYQRLGDNARAIDSYQRAIKLDPANAQAYSNVANLYIREAEYEGALEYANKALERNANLLPAHSARAIAYAGLGDEEAYEKALRQAAAAGADRKRIETAVRYILDEND